MIDGDMIIAVIGASVADGPLAATAEEVGRELARRGAAVVCGGLGGVMEAVCRGAKAEGGTTIGVLPGSDPGAANRYVDIPICTGMGYARNVIVVKTGRSVIAVGGAFGTLSEIGHALADGIPVVGLGTWDLSAPHAGGARGAMAIADSPAAAVDLAMSAAPRRSAPTAEELRG